MLVFRSFLRAETSEANTNFPKNKYMAGPHTVVLMQANKTEKTRIWSDYETLDDALLDIINMFEDHRNNSSKSLSYSATELEGFIEGLTEVVCMVHDGKDKYIPHDKKWVREKVCYMFKTRWQRTLPRNVDLIVLYLNTLIRLKFWIVSVGLFMFIS